MTDLPHGPVTACTCEHFLRPGNEERVCDCAPADDLEVVAGHELSGKTGELRCCRCNAPRALSPCHKCGGELTAAAEGWEEPELPDVDRIRSLAREVGYAVGVHGSLERDLDLIAAPWVAEAVSPRALAEHIAAGLPGRIAAIFVDAPHDRIGFNIKPDGWFRMIDLSVMPPRNMSRIKAIAAADELRRLGCSVPKSRLSAESASGDNP